VALTGDLPNRKLRHGQVGTVVHQLDPGAFEIEFTDAEAMNAFGASRVVKRKVGQEPPITAIRPARLFPVAPDGQG
jgi:hypothetical protein